MTNLSNARKDDPRGESEAYNENPNGPAVVLAFDHRALRASNDAVCLDACREYERILVNTRASVYELIVLQGEVGEVLVRGGRKFPEFRRVRFVGSTAGGSALKVNTIDVGLRMEFHLGHRIVVTSAVQKVLRHAEAADLTARTVAQSA